MTVYFSGVDPGAKMIVFTAALAPLVPKIPENELSRVQPDEVQSIFVRRF